jgi:hypothetical protein
VQGERDAFGSPTELKPHLASMQAPHVLHEIAGADHSLTIRSRKGPDVFAGMMATAAEWMLTQ